MHLKSILAASVVFTGLTTATQAADQINEQGAKDLLANMTHFLTEDLAKSNIVTVKPAGDHYEINYDLQKIVDKMKIPDVDITVQTPVTATATPVSGGVWNLTGDNALGVTVRSKPGVKPDSEFHYALGSSNFTGVFDPALHYLRSLDAKASGITFSTKTTEGQGTTNDGTIDNIVYGLTSSAGSGPDRLNFNIKGNLQTLNSKLTSGPTSADLRIGSIDFGADMTDLPLKALNDMIGFFVAHKKDQKLSPKETETFRTLLVNAMPLIGSFDETVSAKDISVATPFGNGGLQKLDYTVKGRGPAEAANVTVGLSAEKLSLTSGLVPQNYAAFIPNTAEFQVGIPNMNFAAVLKVFQTMDLTKADAGSNADLDKKFQSAIFPDGMMTIDFPKISAVSNLYDIEASGSLHGPIENKNDVSMQFTVYARDLDKTIAAVQDAAKSEPKLSQASFGLMMAKGFAKTDPDGRSRWDISLTDGKSVTINGQVIK
jgi:hypothetical protein